MHAEAAGADPLFFENSSAADDDLDDDGRPFGDYFEWVRHRNEAFYAEQVEYSRCERGILKTIKFVKILVPHVILISMLLGYLSLGATILTWMESSTEVEKATDKVGRLLLKYEQMANDTWELRQSDSIDQAEWAALIRRRLLEIGEIHEGPRYLQWVDDYPAVRTRWTFPTALLYALTVLTTCGYGEVGVYTPVGQLFAVAFALVGIPLMFITAADIGKFLSESLMKVIDLMKSIGGRLKKLVKGKRAGMAAQDKDDEFLEFGAPDQMQKLWFPVLTYVSVISAYCCLGAVMFRTWQPEWPFIHAFHFGFNLIVTVGLGELVVTDPLFLCLIVAFVIIGLSVVTMCVDLASTHLKAYFAQLHYFGRAKKFLDMGDDIRNMMEYLAWMRKKKGGTVTWQDVKDLMETIKLGPYAPRDAARMRWIDETSSAVSTVRHNSCGSEHTLPCHFRHYPGFQVNALHDARSTSYSKATKTVHAHTGHSQSLHPRPNGDRRQSKGGGASASRVDTPYTPDDSLATSQPPTHQLAPPPSTAFQSNHRGPPLPPATPTESAPSLGDPSDTFGPPMGLSGGGRGGRQQAALGYRRVPAGCHDDRS